MSMCSGRARVLGDVCTPHLLVLDVLAFGKAEVAHRLLVRLRLPAAPARVSGTHASRCYLCESCCVRGLSANSWPCIVPAVGSSDEWSQEDQLEKRVSPQENLVHHPSHHGPTWLTRVNTTAVAKRQCASAHSPTRAQLQQHTSPRRASIRSSRFVRATSKPKPR